MGCILLREEGVGHSADAMGLADRMEGDRRV